MMPATAEPPSAAVYEDDHLRIDKRLAGAFVDGRQLILTRKEFELLAALAGHASNIVRRRDLMHDIWGYSEEIRTRTLDVHIRRLRKKLTPHGRDYIETIFGVGYRFVPLRQPLAFGLHKARVTARV